ncbi:helix-turn-helix domain-containing protein [Sinosporangium siamense]|uniref:Transcriptional regulator n=1 Tax=Sinosporangium siamense TaxID=1367973 RepID=A0A919V6S4_9ACTN|nr:helix-turn-helix transcriptional regulator [Sinosporangium siamense]GII92296.1 transcriptional regulator [Sinosporangium siamense]
MTRETSPTVRRRRLASELRRLRERAHMTIEQVAERLGWSATKVSRIETSRVGVALRDVGLLLDLYAVEGAKREELLDLARDAQKKGWWHAFGDIPTEYAAYIGLEAEAASMRSFAPQVVPGLLQTEAYARAIIRSGLVISPQGEVERRVEVRMERQRLLCQDDALRLWAILDEAAIRRDIGGGEVMRPQLEHLLQLTDHPNVTIQVLPFSAGAHPATNGAFEILEFPEPADPDVVFVENLTGSLYIERETDIYQYAMIFDHLRARAADPDETRRLIALAAGH